MKLEATVEKTMITALSFSPGGSESSVISPGTHTARYALWSQHDVLHLLAIDDHEAHDICVYDDFGDGVATSPSCLVDWLEGRRIHIIRFDREPMVQECLESSALYRKT